MNCVASKQGVLICGIVQFVCLNVTELYGMHVIECCVTIALQAAMPYGSMVELLHPHRASEVVGRGMDVHTSMVEATPPMLFSCHLEHK